MKLLKNYYFSAVRVRRELPSVINHHTSIPLTTAMQARFQSVISHALLRKAAVANVPSLSLGRGN
jgi:hypothetical protein